MQSTRRVTLDATHNSQVHMGVTFCHVTRARRTRRAQFDSHHLLLFLSHHAYSPQRLQSRLTIWVTKASVEEMNFRCKNSERWRTSRPTESEQPLAHPCDSSASVADVSHTCCDDTTSTWEGSESSMTPDVVDANLSTEALSEDEHGSQFSG